MRKYLLLLIFNFSLIFSFSSTTNDVENIFADEYGYQNEKTSEIPETLNILQGMRVSIIDPAMIKDNYSKRAISLIYDTLFTFDKNGDVKPHLVKNYKWLNERELLIELKSGIKFNALQPFLKIIKEEKDKEKRDQVFDKIVQLIYKELPYIPISHGRTLVVGAEKYKYIER